MEKKIFVYEDFSSAEPQKLGVLYVDSLRGTEHYSFEYDEEWLRNTNFRYHLDPDLSMFTGRQYTTKQIFEKQKEYRNARHPHGHSALHFFV